jgi:hypothetical protein
MGRCRSIRLRVWRLLRTVIGEMLKINRLSRSMKLILWSKKNGFPDAGSFSLALAFLTASLAQTK